MSKQETIAVKFVKHWRGYNPTEIAAFDAELADRLVEGKVAEKVGAAATNKGSGRSGGAAKADEKTVEKASKAATAADAQAGTSATATGGDGTGAAGGVNADRP